jgi:hypothetical protein
LVKYFIKKDVRRLVLLAQAYESQRKIDSLSNLKKHKTYILHVFIINLSKGFRDNTVKIEASEKLKQFYEMLGVTNITTTFDIAAGHGIITPDFGNECSSTKTPWINKCDYSAAGRILETMYGRLREKVSPKCKIKNKKKGKT